MANEILMPNDWNPRDYQRPLWKYLSSGGKRAVAIWHRRSGKDSLAINWTAKSMLERVGVYWHMLPLNTQARKVIWDGIDKKGRRVIYQAFPPEIIKSVNSQEMKLELINGSIWQCVGSDNYDALVGGNPVGVVFSEYSIANPAAWDFIRPILAENGGWALFIYTPRGHNHGYTLYNQAKQAGWFCQILTVEQTKAIPLSAVDEERQAGMSEAMISQEFYCSFEAVSEEEQKLITFDMVSKVLNNEIISCQESPLIIGVDPARFGDDKTAIARRRGRQIYGLQKLSKLSVVEVANCISHIIKEEKPLRVNIDVGGLGAGVYDILVDRGLSHIVRAVNFGESAQASDKYFNRRAEMWDGIRAWLTNGVPVSIVDAEDIREDLTAPKKGYDQLGRLKLEKKEDIKKRIGRSTDIGDAVALTFAEPFLATNSVMEERVDDTLYF